jgi:hypothetical protein
VPDPRELSREELLAALAERDAVIAALLAEIEQLKRRVGMDSSNSSMPPGSDGPAARARRARKPGKRSPRPRGGQPGHEGHALACRSDPDQVTVVTPGQCAGCGHDLGGLEGKVAERVQVSDTPPVRLQVTEYRMIEVACPACGMVTRAATPAGLAAPCCYGPDVRAATALLACNGHMSIERAADLMGVLLDAPVPAGFTGAWWPGWPPAWRNSRARSSSGCGPLRCCTTMRPRHGWRAMTATGCCISTPPASASWSGSGPPPGAVTSSWTPSASCPATAARWSATTTPPTPSTTSS